MLDRIKTFFEFERLGTTYRSEVTGGVTTFMTMAYIIFVNPAILGDAGMDFNAVMMATCLSAAVATLVMALVARYPIALAPGMGMNAFFAYEVVRMHGASWQTALGMVLVSGVLFLALTLAHFRETLINAIPGALKYAMAAGIGLFIAFIGLQHAGIAVGDPATLVRMGDLSDPKTIIAMVALAVTALMLAARIRGAILIGIIIAGALGMTSGAIHLPADFSPVALPPSISPTAFKFELAPIFKSGELIALVFVLLFFELFDTVGTLIGVSEQAGLLDDEGKLPRVNRALLADSAGVMAGAALGTSPVTAYIESASGVAAGARSGFASVVAAALFVAAVFFAPVVKLLAVPFVTAPALIAVGCMMMASAAKIEWKNVEDAVPAFLTMVLMPLTFSISKGMAVGLVAWPVLMTAAGKGRKVHPILHALAAVIVVGVAANYLIFPQKPAAEKEKPVAEKPEKPAEPEAPVKPAVVFPDCKLEALVRKTIPKPEGDLHDEDFARLYELNGLGLGIVSLSGLEHCTALEKIELSTNMISDLAPLADLKRLTSLKLANNRIQDITPLRKIYTLRKLNLSMNRISDLNPLGPVALLLEADLSRNNISDISPLAGLVEIRSLNLSDNRISDLTPLTKFKELLVLNLSQNQISDLGPLSSLPQVTTFDLWGNQIQDLEPLVELNKSGGLKIGSHLRVFRNPLSEKALEQQVPYLQQNGVMVQQ